MTSRLLSLAMICIAFGAMRVSAQTGVRRVELDRQTIFNVCPNNLESECDIHHTSVRVNVTAENAENLTYYYVPSAGRIIGTGPNVVWDLTPQVHPGNYSITVGVGRDKVLIGQAVTQTLKVSVCPVCDLGCYCPNVSLSGPSAVKAGDSVVMTAELSDDTNVEYTWTVTGGTIVNGQGTKQIIVSSEKGKNPRNVNIKLAVAGPWCADCPREFKSEIAVSPK